MEYIVLSIFFQNNKIISPQYYQMSWHFLALNDIEMNTQHQYIQKKYLVFFIIYTKYKYNHVLKCTHSIHLYPSALSRSVKTKVTLQFSNLENKRRG